MDDCVLGTWNSKRSKDFIYYHLMDGKFVVNDGFIC